MERILSGPFSMSINSSESPKVYHIYIQQSIPYPNCFYTGDTEDVDQRLD
ncbi:hypothetical protein ACFL27_23730 [candidate division CSSED10-310 bacterium]|uniref:Uncharacterized protein n=1 Tax=candidate division CSSED10-310 bacterium TaxID=2855610 RepID=A0ABV6Z445_UNCC1